MVSYFVNIYYFDMCYFNARSSNHIKLAIIGKNYMGEYTIKQSFTGDKNCEMNLVSFAFSEFRAVL